MWRRPKLIRTQEVLAPPAKVKDVGGCPSKGEQNAVGTPLPRLKLKWKDHRVVVAIFGSETALVRGRFKRVEGSQPSAKPGCRPFRRARMEPAEDSSHVPSRQGQHDYVKSHSEGNPYRTRKVSENSRAGSPRPSSMSASPWAMTP